MYFGECWWMSKNLAKSVTQSVSLLTHAMSHRQSSLGDREGGQPLTQAELVPATAIPTGNHRHILSPR